jgi:hypothetical protein
VIPVHFLYQVVLSIKLENRIAYKLEVEGRSPMHFQYKLKSKPATALINIRADVSPSIIAIDASTEKHSILTNYQWTTRKKEFEPSIWEDFTPFILNHKGMIEYVADRKYKVARDENCTAMIVDGYNWKHISKVCYLRVCNLSDKKVIGNLVVSEYQEQDLIAGEILDKCKIFKEVFSKTKGGSISQEERNVKELHGSEYTYGEIEVLYFIDLLKTVYTKKGGVFWDLGSGAGKALIAAALGYNSFDKICGVEQLEGLYTVSIEIINKFCAKSNIDKSLFSVVKGDMRTIDWSNADVIYASSICFPDDLIKELAEKGKSLKKGTIILSLKAWHLKTEYKVVNNIQLKMTWGKTGLYIIEKL